ncbi:MAG: GyrI-like domain-containing protein [Bauldia sp.]
MAARIDLKAELKSAYKAGRKPAIADIPEQSFLMVDGAGDPNSSPAYKAAVEALFGTAYTLKFASKKAGGPDFAVMPLEGLWWADDMTTFITRDKSSWSWTMMIAVPSFVTPDDVDAAKATVAQKKELPALRRLSLRPLHEGRVVQMLHVGPYDDEGPAIEAMHAFAAAEGFSLHGRHHEIYLSDPRRTEPARLKTILRQPIR